MAILVTNATLGKKSIKLSEEDRVKWLKEGKIVHKGGGIYVETKVVAAKGKDEDETPSPKPTPSPSPSPTPAPTPEPKAEPKPAEVGGDQEYSTKDMTAKPKRSRTPKESDEDGEE